MKSKDLIKTKLNKSLSSGYMKKTEDCKPFGKNKPLV